MFKCYVLFIMTPIIKVQMSVCFFYVHVELLYYYVFAQDLKCFL
jgi:hypothetical protein